MIGSFRPEFFRVCTHTQCVLTNNNLASQNLLSEAHHWYITFKPLIPPLQQEQHQCCLEHA